MKAFFVILFAGMVGGVSLLPVAAKGAATYSEKVLYSFCAQKNCKDGTYPDGGVIAVNGSLYGTTAGGGRGAACGTTPGCGVVFSLDPNTGSETVLYSFCRELNCPDGTQPWFGLITVKGILYGLTASGGGSGCFGSGCGTVFSLNPATGAEATLYSFDGSAHGSTPQGDLIHVKRTIYGTTQGGGTGSLGVAFALDSKTGAETVLHSFSGGTDGQNPLGVIDVNGMLYGTTVIGGSTGCETAGCGTVFSINPDTGTETVLHAFGSGTDGEWPEGGLVAINGILYGTTFAGGVAGCGGLGCGTVFSIDPGTGVETVLYTFCSRQNCTDGATPYGTLIEVKGTLYGTTSAGGSTDCGGSGCGTVFSIDPNTGAESVIYSFSGGDDGADPQSRLIAVNGDLYGTTDAGGAHDSGTVFVVRKKREARPPIRR